MKLFSFAAPLLRVGLDEVRVSEMQPEELRARLTRRTRMLIDPRKATNYRFTRFGPGGNSPYQLASDIYLRTGSREAVVNFLTEFISGFRPRSLAELLFGRHSEEFRPLDGMPPRTKFQPWATGFHETPGFIGQIGTTFDGVNPAQIAKEATKQIAAVTSLRDGGYQPETHRHGYFRGRLLFSGGDYRFIVEDGKHRVGALNALGFEGEIAVRLMDEHPAVVIEDELEQWPLVAKGECTPELARLLLRRHFA